MSSNCRWAEDRWKERQKRDKEQYHLFSSCDVRRNSVRSWHGQGEKMYTPAIWIYPHLDTGICESRILKNAGKQLIKDKTIARIWAGRIRDIVCPFYVLCSCCVTASETMASLPWAALSWGFRAATKVLYSVIVFFIIKSKLSHYVKIWNFTFSLISIKLSHVLISFCPDVAKQPDEPMQWLMDLKFPFKSIKMRASARQRPRPH